MLGYYAECRILYTIMLNVILLSVVMLNVIVLIAIMLNIIVLSVVMLNAELKLTVAIFWATQ